MPPLPRRLVALCALAAALGARPAAGQVLLINGNFDANTPTYSYGYTYAQTGTSSFTSGVQAGSGVGGTAGYRIVADFTGAAGSTFSGFGGGSGQVPISTPLVFPTNFSQFTYSFAVNLTGFAAAPPATTGINLELAFNAPDNTLLPADADPDADLILRLNLDPAPAYNVATGGFQTIAGNFGSATASAGSLAQLQAFSAAVNQVQLNINFNGGGGHFGFDAGNVGVYDNLVVTQVPEPSALALAGLGGLALIRRRRRR